jgi:hypothetical protein
MKAPLRLRKRVVPTLALAACMIPLAISATALAQSQDLRSPDARDAAAGDSQQTQYVLPQDFVSPDARDAAAGVSQQTQYVLPQDFVSADARDAAAGVSQQTQYVLPQDFVSPDARDAAAGISRTSSGVSQPSPAAPTVVIEHGTQTLAIVFASTALGIALAGAAFMLMAVYRRPRRAWSAPY